MNQAFRHHYTQLTRKRRHIVSQAGSKINGSLKTFDRIESVLFFQNEPRPLASSVVDDLATLASVVYIVSVIVILLVLFAWLTHYNSSCLSLITSLLSTITGLPEPIIRSVALCGSCFVWCEKTWLFRRIHQFNVHISNQTKQLLSSTCKIFYDTICPCCRPSDTPSTRSLIGSLPTNLIETIRIPDTAHSSKAQSPVKTKEPVPISSESVAIDLGLFRSTTTTTTTTQSLVQNHDSNIAKARIIDPKTNINHVRKNQLTNKKRHRPARKRTQLKQRSTTSESAYIEQQIDDRNEETDEDEQDKDNEEIEY